MKPLDVSPLPLQFPATDELSEMLDELYIGLRSSRQRFLRIYSGNNKPVWVIRLEICDSGEEIAYCNRIMVNDVMSAHLQIILNEENDAFPAYYRYDTCNYKLKMTRLRAAVDIKMLKKVKALIKSSFYHAIDKLNAPYYEQIRAIGDRYTEDVLKWEKENL